MSAAIGRDVERAALCLRRGGLVGLPTETVYGLAGDGLSSAAVARIFSAKGRPSFDPLILHIHSADQVGTVASAFPAPLRRLADAFWPGPLTLLLPKASAVPDAVTAGLPRVAVRVPSHPLALELLAAFGGPLAAPSANPFGYVSPTTAAHVADQLGDAVDYILDGGPCAVGVESTIVGLEDGGRVVVHRPGGIPLEALALVVEGEVGLGGSAAQEPTGLIAPGTLSSHYAPSKGLRIAENRRDALVWLESNPRGVLFSVGDPPRGAFQDRFWPLDPVGDGLAAAKNFYAFLRRLDASEFEAAVVERLPDAGLGRAVNDRLRRAAFAKTPGR